MDDFVEHMLKSAQEKKKVEAHQSEVDTKEVEDLTKQIQKKLQEK